MTTRSLILSIGCAVIALSCFFPPQRDFRVQKYDGIDYGGKYKTVQANDYYALGIRIAGIAALTAAAYVLAGDRKRTVVNADMADRSVSR